MDQQSAQGLKSLRPGICRIGRMLTMLQEDEVVLDADHVLDAALNEDSFYADEYDLPDLGSSQFGGGYPD